MIHFYRNQQETPIHTGRLWKLAMSGPVLKACLSFQKPLFHKESLHALMMNLPLLF